MVDTQLLKLLAFTLLLVGVCQAADTSHGRSNVTDRENDTDCGMDFSDNVVEVKPECAMHEEGGFNSEVHVARLEFERVQVIFIVAMFIIIVVLAKMVWHHNWMHPVSSNIPESCMLIIVGAHIGGILIGSFYIDECNRDQPPPLRFTPEIFFLFLLPPIVLESGYYLDNRAFFENFTTITVFAVIGTLWNAAAIGMTLYGLHTVGALLTETSVQGALFTPASALLFGTICSAVDPVAVLAVFDDIHVKRLLHILVFGESLLNDAVTIVLFKVLGAFANRPFDESITNAADRNIDWDDIVIGIVQFFVVVLASFVIGVVIGMVAAFITRFSEHVHVLEPIIVFTMGYLSYILADMFEFSGIVSLIFCAITMRHYVEANISRKSSTTIKYTMKVVSNVSEMVIFLFLGLSLYESGLQNWDWGLSLWSLLFALLYRPIGVIALTLIVNIFRVKKIGFKSVFVMSYSGLRGAVAFSLALTRIHEEPSLEHPMDCMTYSEAQLRKTMLTATTFIVLFTVFVQGITIKPLVRMIKVRTASTQKPTLNEVIHGTTIDHVMSGLEDILGHYGHNRLREKIVEIDSKYFRKIFERYPEARNEQILHTFKRLQYQESHKAVEQNLVFEYHKDEDGRSGSHISLIHENEYLECPLPESMPEECIPSLNDILAASFANPHEDHFGHVLSTTDREPEDHHFEPVNVRRDIIRAKHRQRRNRHKRRRHLSQLMKTSSERAVSEDQDPHERIAVPMDNLGEEVPPVPTDYYYPEQDRKIEDEIIEDDRTNSGARIVPSVETDV